MSARKTAPKPARPAPKPARPAPKPAPKAPVGFSGILRDLCRDLSNAEVARRLIAVAGSPYTESKVVDVASLVARWLGGSRRIDEALVNLFASALRRHAVLELHGVRPGAAVTPGALTYIAPEGTWGRVLHDARELAGWSRAEMARRIHELEGKEGPVDPRNVGWWEGAVKTDEGTPYRVITEEVVRTYATVLGAGVELRFEEPAG